MAGFCFVFDATRCTGCKTCVLACKDVHDLPNGVAFRQVYEYEGSAGAAGTGDDAPAAAAPAAVCGSAPAGAWKQDALGAWSCDAYVYYVSLACNHCADPVCMRVCPTGAMHRDGLGFVVVDARRCVGCGYCAMSCPYHAPHLDYDLGRSVKCDGCTARVAASLAPACVAACPQRALDFGDVSRMREIHGTGDEFAPLPPASYTVPALIAIAPRDARPCDDAMGVIANRSELV